MTVTTADMMRMSQAKLDELYRNSLPGTIPNGDSQGTAIIAPGASFSNGLSSLIKSIAWRGKVFHREQQYLLNKITPFQIHLIKAQIYMGDSWVSDGQSIILDYSKTSFVAQQIRDEIREVAPCLYLGNAYWGKTRVLNFILEF